MKKRKKLTREEVEEVQEHIQDLQAVLLPGTTVIGSNASFGTCEECGEKDEELRPYGEGGKNICYECGQKNPVRTEAAMRNFLFKE
jgi:formylmethanofuran dehydrogenase subunit E